jgi:hypothetical protein
VKQNFEYVILDPQLQSSTFIFGANNGLYTNIQGCICISIDIYCMIICRNELKTLIKVFRKQKEEKKGFPGNTMLHIKYLDSRNVVFK